MNTSSLKLLKALLGAVCVFMLNTGVMRLARAAEFRSLNAVAVLYDAPSSKGNKIYIAPRAMPVEIISSLGEWIKVRDAQGDLSWVEKKNLGMQRNLVVQAAFANINSAANETASVVFGAEKGVLLELLEAPANAWVKVRHRDGQIGYIKLSDVWGV